MRKTYIDNIRWATVLLVLIYHVCYMFNGVGVPGGITNAENIPAAVLKIIRILNRYFFGVQWHPGIAAVWITPAYISRNDLLRLTSYLLNFFLRI